MARYIQSKYQNLITGEVTTDLSGPFSNSMNAESALCSLLDKEGIISAQIVDKEQRESKDSSPHCSGRCINPDLEKTPAERIAKLRSEID
jgi:hypothetical protein